MTLGPHESYFEVSLRAIAVGEDADEVARYVAECLRTEPDVAEVEVGSVRAVRRNAE